MHPQIRNKLTPSSIAPTIIIEPITAPTTVFVKVDAISIIYIYTQYTTLELY